MGKYKWKKQEYWNFLLMVWINLKLNLDANGEEWEMGGGGGGGGGLGQRLWMGMDIFKKSKVLSCKIEFSGNCFIQINLQKGEK